MSVKLCIPVGHFLMGLADRESKNVDNLVDGVFFDVEEFEHHRPDMVPRPGGTTG